MSSALLQATIDAARPQLLELISAGKSAFLKQFGSWVQSLHQDRLEQLFENAARAKINQLSAQTPEQAQAFQDEYLDAIAGLETLGLADWIVTKADAVAVMQSWLHAFLGVLPAVAGGVAQAACSILIPGVGGLIGPGVNWGVKAVVGYFVEKAEGPSA